jgi:hypothetical protein
MPLSKIGKKVKRAFMKEYGKKRGSSIFFASERKRIPGASKWTKKSRKKR